MSDERFKLKLDDTVMYDPGALRRYEYEIRYVSKKSGEERTRTVHHVYKPSGNPRGRPPVNSDTKARVIELRRMGGTLKEIAAATGISTQTVRKVLRERDLQRTLDLSPEIDIYPPSIQDL